MASGIQPYSGLNGIGKLTLEIQERNTRENNIDWKKEMRAVRKSEA